MAVLLNRSPLSGQWGLELGQGGSKRERNVYRTDGGTGMMRTRWKGAALELRMASPSLRGKSVTSRSFFLFIGV